MEGWAANERAVAGWHGAIQSGLEQGRAWAKGRRELQQTREKDLHTATTMPPWHSRDRVSWTRDGEEKSKHDERSTMAQQWDASLTWMTSISMDKEATEKG